MTRKLYFTVDADRDVNIPIPGSVAAGSIDRGSGTGPRFSSSERGMSVLVDLLDDIGVRGTFFLEGRTAEMADCPTSTQRLWEAAQILWAVAQFSAPLPVALALAGWETLVTLVWAFPVYGFHRFCCVHYGRIYHE